ncbi:MAG: DUF4838 domain-containing protein, partial [Candidatus Omnitrophica bacterium]|nr:DUF4838 domain-containing protein [Candidatus Omnitrophota bacterium]
LALYVQKATGARLRILKESAAFPEKNSEFFVLVGATQKTKSLGISLQGIKDGGFLIRRTGNFLVLWGEDDRVKYYQGKTLPADPKTRSHTRHGTLFAVYDFLEKVAGVRWYWPGSLGEVVPNHRNLYVEEIDYRENPDFQFRGCYGYWLDDPDFKREESALWWRRQRLGSAGYIPATHSFAKYVSKYGQSHPEYFALQRDGRRLTDTDHGGGHICLSNKEFQKLLIADLIENFQANPDLFTQSVMPGDSFAQYGCQCQECQAKYQESVSAFQSEGLFSPASGKHSKMVWEYVNQVAREVGRIYPDRYIGCCAYASYYAVPSGIKFEPNVAVTVCRGNADLYFWDQKDINLSHRQLEAWAKRVSLIFTWEYPCSANNYGNCVIYPNGVNQEAKRLKQRGVRGTIVEYVPSYDEPKYGGDYTGWMRENLTTYVFFRSLWKTEIDVDQLVKEYCENLYGPAAGPMKEFFWLMEDIWKNGHHGFKPYYSNWSNIWTYLYSPVNVTRLVKMLEKAKRLAPPGIYQQRVEKTIEGFKVLRENGQVVQE